MLTSHYPAKILLLGEYTILNGSKAFALPYHALGGSWSFEIKDCERREASRKSLLSFIENSQTSLPNLAQFKTDFDKGLWFDSTIPQGFGLGSSGAVIAAIYEKYGRPTKNLKQDKSSLAKLEDFFHGSSSGLDPLVSHLQKPLLIHNFDEVEVLEQQLHLDNFFLLNTKRPRQTGPLVNIYQEKMKDQQFKQGCAEILVTEVNFAIDAVVKNESANLFHHLWHISKFQWDFFPEMIPTNERSLWAQGIESGDYVLKLCGAGGGGFLLGYSSKYNFREMQNILTSHELRTLR